MVFLNARAVDKKSSNLAFQKPQYLNYTMENASYDFYPLVELYQTFTRSFLILLNS